MTSIIMLITHLGSPDGFSVFQYVQGEEYPQEGFPMSEDLASVFLREGWACPASELGLPDVETTMELVTETSAVCGHITKSGGICQNRKPCRWHG